MVVHDKQAMTVLAGRCHFILVEDVVLIHLLRIRTCLKGLYPTFAKKRVNTKTQPGISSLQ